VAKNEKQWESYEQVAAYLLDQIAEKLGLVRVEGAQTLSGTVSGTKWRVDAKGVKVGDAEGFVIIECRRYPIRKITQEAAGGLAYRIRDTGAAGGIFVTPIGLQEGAAKVAAAENIELVRMTENSTRENYLLQFLNDLFIGVTDTIHVTEEVTAIVRSTDGSEEVLLQTD
jgi:hypothetical protein